MVLLGMINFRPKTPSTPRPGQLDLRIPLQVQPLLLGGVLQIATDYCVLDSRVPALVFQRQQFNYFLQCFNWGVDNSILVNTLILPQFSLNNVLTPFTVSPTRKSPSRKRGIRYFCRCPAYSLQDCASSMALHATAA